MILQYLEKWNIIYTLWFMGIYPRETLEYVSQDKNVQERA